MTAEHIRPVRVNEETLLERCSYFSEVQVWPLKARLHPEEWLDNFLVDERPYAVQLLSAFLYYAEPMVDRLLFAAVQSLSSKLPSPANTHEARTQQWGRFLSEALFSWVTGEDPNYADSGFIFARKARDVLGIDQHLLAPPDVALNALHAHS